MPLKVNRSTPLFLFYLVIIYVCLQFIWWAWLLVQLNKEVYTYKSEIAAVRISDPVAADAEQKILENNLHKKRLMIAGEGCVFIVLLIVGIKKTQAAFKKEANLTKQQKNFLLSITHELKSPLASNKLYLQTLLKHDLQKEKQKEIIENALKDTDRLNQLIDNFLLAAKIDSGTIPLERSTIELSGFIKGRLTEFNRHLLKDRKIITDLDSKLFIAGDVTAITSIFHNIFENALKYSPADSTIWIATGIKNNMAFFSVSDEGSGIDDLEKENIFRKFYRTGNEDTRNTKGTGLGLYIVKYLTGLLNGKILVRNNSPKGSIFEIYFPLVNEQ